MSCLVLAAALDGETSSTRSGHRILPGCHDPGLLARKVVLVKGLRPFSARWSRMRRMALGSRTKASSLRVAALLESGSSLVSRVWSRGGSLLRLGRSALEVPTLRQCPTSAGVAERQRRGLELDARSFSCAPGR